MLEAEDGEIDQVTLRLQSFWPTTPEPTRSQINALIDESGLESFRLLDLGTTAEI